MRGSALLVLALAAALALNGVAADNDVLADVVGLTTLRPNVFSFGRAGFIEPSLANYGLANTVSSSFTDASVFETPFSNIASVNSESESDSFSFATTGGDFSGFASSSGDDSSFLQLFG